MNRFTKAIISVVLAVSMLCGLVLTAFAEDDEYVMLSFGDSMSNGYVLEDFDHSVRGCGEGLSKMSYPYLMRQYLTDKLGKELKAYNFTFQGSRPNEFYGMLAHADNPDLDDYTLSYLDLFEEAYRKGCLRDYWTDLHGLDLYGAIEKLVPKADLITVDIGMNNFGTYFFDRLGSVFAGEEPDELHDGHYSEIIQAVNAKYGTFVEEFRVGAAALMSALDAEVVDRFLDAFLYCYCSFLYYFDLGMTKLHDMNPDATVICVGTFGCFPGLTATMDGVNINMDLIMDLLFRSVNFFMKNLCSQRSWYKFADCTPGVQTFAGELQTEEGITTASVRNAVIDDMFSLWETEQAETLTVLFNKVRDFYGSVEYYKVIAAFEAVRLLATLEQDYEENPRSCEADAYSDYVKSAYAAKGTVFDTNLYEEIRAVVDDTAEAYHTAALIGLADLKAAFGKTGYDYTGVLAAGGSADDKQALAGILCHYIADGYNVGMHPSPMGAYQKFEYVKKAYELKFTADGSVYNKIIDAVTDITPAFSGILSNLFDFILNIQRTIISAITGVLSGLLNGINL